jgi:hypothetical protein
MFLGMHLFHMWDLSYEVKLWDMNNIALRMYNDVLRLHKNIKEHHYLFIIEK